MTNPTGDGKTWTITPLADQGLYGLRIFIGVQEQAPEMVFNFQDWRLYINGFGPFDLNFQYFNLVKGFQFVAPDTVIAVLKPAFKPGAYFMTFDSAQWAPIRITSNYEVERFGDMRSEPWLEFVKSSPRLKEIAWAT